MAMYDHGGGCACGLQRYCDCSDASELDLRNAWIHKAERKYENARNNAERALKELRAAKAELHLAREVE